MCVYLSRGSDLAAALKAQGSCSRSGLRYSMVIQSCPAGVTVLPFKLMHVLGPLEKREVDVLIL